MVDVLSIEYPPFTGSNLPENGLSFRLLRAYAQEHMKVDVRPRFLPPARAQVLLRDAKWCLSFYPPKNAADLSGFIPLSDQRVDLGLFRRAQSAPFGWTDLKELAGGKLAIFRTPTLGALHRQLGNAGLELVFIDHLEQGFKLLINNRVDYVFADRATVNNLGYTRANVHLFQFGETLLSKTQVGVFYNKACASMLFRADF